MITYIFTLCLIPKKFEGKCEGKKIKRKNVRKEKIEENKKNIFKIKKLFVYVSSNSFHLFSLITLRLNNFKFIKF